MTGKGATIKKTSSKTVTLIPSASKLRPPSAGVPGVPSYLAGQKDASCGCSGEETSAPKSGPPKIPSASRIAGPSKIAGPTRTAIPRPGSGIPQTGPKLVKSSITTTSHDVSGRTVKKTVTSQKQSVGKTPSQRSIAVPQKPPARTIPKVTTTRPTPARRPKLASEPPMSLETSQLVKEVEKELLEKSIRSGDESIAKGARTSRERGSAPVIMTKRGPVPVDAQLTLERRVERTQAGEHVTEHITGIRPQDGQKLEMDRQHFDPSAGLRVTEPPSKEVLTIKSSISVGGQVAQKVKTVIFEKTGPPEPTLAEISQMVDDENENIEEGLKMSIKARVLGKSPKKEKPHEDAPEDLQPEMLAAIMHTEEQGLAMAAPPTQLYNYLFPEGGADASIPVSSVIAAPLQDVVVPTSVPKELHITVNNEDLQQAQASTAEKVQASPRKPTDSMYAEANQGQVPQVPPTPAVPKGKRKLGLLTAEQAPWADQDLQPIADLVGAGPSPATTSGFEYSMTEPVRMFPSDTNGLEYILVPQPPSHVSRVQLRGTTKPTWFPGFYVALPEKGPGVALTKSPSGVLTAAWRSMQPAVFDDDSFVVG